MAYVALRCDLASHNWSLKLAAANEKKHFWPLVLKHKQISQYSTLICLLVYQDMTCNSVINTASKSTALVWSPLLYVQKNTTRSLHPLGFYEVLCLLLMSFVISGGEQKFQNHLPTKKVPETNWRREVVRFEDAEIQYPNIPNEWEQRKRDKPLPDIPWNTDWLFNRDPHSGSCLIPIWLGCTIPYIQQITRVFGHCSLDKRWKLAKGVALPQDSEMFLLKYWWIMDLNGVSSWWLVHKAIWKICASQIGSVPQGWK